MKILRDIFWSIFILGNILGGLFWIIAAVEQNRISTFKKDGYLVPAKVDGFINRNSTLYFEVSFKDANGALKFKEALIPASLYPEYIDEDMEFRKNIQPLEVYDIADEEQIMSKAYTEPGAAPFYLRYEFCGTLIGAAFISLILIRTVPAFKKPKPQV